jgi:hypothetical protein
MPTTPGVTITGKLEDLAGNNNAGKLIWTLQNFADFPPRVSGTMMLTPVRITTQAAADGTFSQVLWGNYQLTPSNTFYQCEIQGADGSQVVVAAFQFNSGGSFDLSTMVPISGSSPPIFIPTAVTSFNGRTGTVLPANGDYSFSQISGIVGASQLPTPTATTLGGVQSKAASGHLFITGLGTDGVLTTAQPAFSDISGTVAAGQLPNPSTSSLGGVQAVNAVSHQWINSISALGVPALSQPSFTDISGTQTAGQQPSTTVNAITNDTNITGSISAQTLTLGFTGTMAAGRLNSNVVQSVTNDTNVTGSIAAQALTLGWTGTLAKGRTLAATVYTDQSNVWGAFLQKFQAGANFDLVDPTDTTKITQFDLSHISTATTRTVNVPDANSTTVQSSSAGSHQFATGVSSQGVVSYAQPAFTDISGTVAATQLPNPSATTLGGIESIAAQSHKWINSISTSGVPSLTQPAAADLSDGTTGSGLVVLATSPTLTTPNIGAATATSITGLTGAFTPNAAGGTDIGSASKPFANLYIGGSATNNIKVTGTASAARTFTLPDADSNPVQPFGGAAHQFVTSILSTGLIISARPSVSDLSDGTTGSGSVVLATSPTLVTPTLGVASATSINKLAITAPATGSTLAIADGKTLTASNTLTLAGTDSTTLTFQGTGTVVNRDSTDTLTHKTIDTAGTGNHIQLGGVDLPASIGTSGQVLTNSSGVLAFTTVSGGGGGTPGGATNSIQYNTGSTFGGEGCLSPAGTLLPNASFKSSIVHSTSTGNTDIYTCPANKRAIITEITVFNGHASTSSTLVPMLKIGSTYYPMTPSATVTNQLTGSRSVTYILEAGETIAVNMTQQPFNVVATIMEFDNTSNLKSAKITTPTLTSGDNTIYTVPNGKSALVLNNTLTMCSGTSGTFGYGNASGGNITVKFNVVASGGSPSTSNLMSPNNGTTNVIATGLGYAPTATSFSMGAGDFISVNLSGGGSDQIAFVTVVEM